MATAVGSPPSAWWRMFVATSVGATSGWRNC